MPINSAIRNLLKPLPDKPIHSLNKKQMAHFRRLIGWEEGPTVPYPTRAEKAIRQKREAWKRQRAGKGRPEPCLLYRKEHIAQFKKNARTDRATARWFKKLLTIADGVAALPIKTFTHLIEDLGPWNCSGVFCPNCVNQKSPQSVHSRFWTWSVNDPDRITCPYCGITYPHADYPEEGVLNLPRLNLQYRFYLSPEELATPDWRTGQHALRYAGFPVHTSISGEIRSTKLDWTLGQVEPLALAFALTGKKKYARTAKAIFLRLAEVYPGYPLNSYIQDVVDAEPGYTTEHTEAIPTLFKKNGFLTSYTGILDDRHSIFGQNKTTPYTTRVASGAWGCTRLAREKSATGQLFVSLFKAYDLIKTTIAPEHRRKIEQDFLLEQYLDVKALSQRIDNKTGPGATARAAIGIFYNDTPELEEGLRYFHAVIESQYHPDGSPKEAPIYASKPVHENLWELPEIVRSHIDLYKNSAYGRGLRMFANIATPLGTQPPIDDSPAIYRLPPTIVDVARIRTGVPLSYGPKDFSGFNLTDPRPRIGTSFYVPMPGQLPDKTNNGFHPVGFLQLPYEKKSTFSMFNEPLPAPRKNTSQKSSNHYYHDRGLACLGFRSGTKATQLYLNGEDGLTGHRHNGPLSLLFFTAGRELFPDLGYIADHPANTWIKSTPAHNTVTVNEQNHHAAGPGIVNAFLPDGPIRFVDITVPIEGLDHFRRAIALIQKSDGLPVLVDIFDVTGGRTHDYQIRVNDPDNKFSIPQLAFKNRSPLYETLSNSPLNNFRTGGRTTNPITATWGKSLRTRATVLTPCTEVITYSTPAWRDYKEVFAAPQKAFDTLVLRNRKKRSRFVVVYECYRDKSTLGDIDLQELQPTVSVHLKERTGRSYDLTIGDGDIDTKITRKKS